MRPRAVVILLALAILAATDAAQRPSSAARRASHGMKKMVNGRSCPAAYTFTHPSVSCNASIHAEGVVCANSGIAHEAYCSYDVGDTACAWCADWELHGPTCRKPDITLGEGICNEEKLSKFSRCVPRGVSDDRAGSKWAKKIAAAQNATECASFSKRLCDFVNGTAKADTCSKVNGTVPYCGLQDLWWQRCNSDWDCRHDDSPDFCCHSQALLIEAWAAKLCNGNTTTGQALVNKMLSKDADFGCKQSRGHEGECTVKKSTYTVNGHPCAAEAIVVEEALSHSCKHGVFGEGTVCHGGNPVTPEEYEGFCSYDVGPEVCARCAAPIDLTAPSDSKYFVVMTVTMPYIEYTTALEGVDKMLGEAEQHSFRSAVTSAASTSAANVEILSITEKTYHSDDDDHEDHDHARRGEEDEEIVVDVETKIRANNTDGMDALATALGSDLFKDRLDASLWAQGLGYSKAITAPTKGPDYKKSTASILTPLWTLVLLACGAALF